MNKKFEVKHFIIIGLLIVSIISISIYFFADNCNACQIKTNSPQEITTISQSEWKLKYETNEYIIIDVRTPKEFNLDKIGNPINIDFYSSNFETELDKLDKNKQYLIYCRSGNRATQSLKVFKELNFTNVYNLEGGISDWNN